MDAPVVAAVNGTAAGAAVGLVAMADLAVCGRSSQFNLAYTNVGLTPDAGTSFLLPRIVGAKRAMELLLLNRDRKSTRLNPSHEWISYAVFCLKKKNETRKTNTIITENTTPTEQNKSARMKAESSTEVLEANASVSQHELTSRAPEHI